MDRIAAFAEARPIAGLLRFWRLIVRRQGGWLGGHFSSLSCRPPSCTTRRGRSPLPRKLAPRPLHASITATRVGSIFARNDRTQLYGTQLMKSFVPLFCVDVDRRR